MRRFRALMASWLALTLGIGGGVFVAERARAADVAILDTLGAATPSTTFSALGAGGQSVFSSQFAGPRIDLAEPMTITEIGGFVNNCASIVGGVPQCPGTLPFTVQIRPSVNGAPDPSTILATFVLSHDNDPLVISFESVSTNVTLGPGAYFALFAPQGDDAGSLMGFATSPFEYQAGLTPVGSLDPVSGNAFSSDQFAAVRVLGHAPAKTKEQECFGLTATIVGTNGSDIISGTQGPDVIDGLGGNDTIDGLGGDDLICGGPGSDSLQGGSGADTMSGEQDADTVFGGEEADVLRSGAGDQVHGGPGDDLLRADGKDPGSDALYGEEGVDTLKASVGNDFLSGGDGDDNLVGGDDNDAIFGAAGDDELSGGSGDDSLDGGEGFDRCNGGEGVDSVAGCELAKNQEN